VSLSIELDISFDDLNKHFVHRIQEFEVKDALKRMKVAKTMDLDGFLLKYEEVLDVGDHRSNNRL
jgi:hypothetical protein